MSTKATREPWAQKCSTIEAPMPLAPPVTRTTRSRRLGYVAYVMKASLGCRKWSRLVGGEPALTLAQASRLAGTSGDPVSSAGMDPITLRARPARRRPRASGRWRDRALLVRDDRTAPTELLRPAPDLALARRDPWAMGCFPLVPWSNRIRAGRFVFGARAVSLPPSRPQDRHAHPRPRLPDVLVRRERRPGGGCPRVSASSGRVAVGVSGRATDLRDARRASSSS